MSGVFVEKVEIKAGDVDMYNRWRTSAIFATVQEVSGHHMETIKSGREDLLVHGLAWVVARVKLEMTRYPRHGETILVKTWAANPIKFLYPRYTVFEDEQGLEVGKAVVIWSVIDLGTHRLVTVPNALVKFFEYERNVPIALTMPTKLSFEGLTSTYVHRVNYCDIDFNRHANNARYLDWIYNAVDYRYFADRVAKSVQINYQKEVAIGDDIHLQWTLENDVLKVAGIKNGDIAFQALLEF